MTTWKVVSGGEIGKSLFQEVTHAMQLKFRRSSMARYLANIRTCQEVSIWKTYQNFKSEDNDHLSITNCNRACFAKLAPRGLQEAMFQCYPLGCPRNGQADPPRINIEYSKEWRFLLERNNGVSLSFHVILSIEDAFWRLHPIISRYSSKNRRIPILKDRSIGLMK